MGDREKYLFDPEGFLVVESFLTSGEVAVLNAAIDAINANDANADKRDEHIGGADSPELEGNHLRGY